LYRSPPESQALSATLGIQRRLEYTGILLQLSQTLQVGPDSDV
jgi:hypothetical protein